MFSNIFDISELALNVENRVLLHSFSSLSRGLNVKHFYNGVVQVQDHFRYGFVEIDM